jgi:hypothetical protein
VIKSVVVDAIFLGSWAALSQIAERVVHDPLTDWLDGDVRWQFEVAWFVASWAGFLFLLLVLLLDVGRAVSEAVDGLGSRR